MKPILLAALVAAAPALAQVPQVADTSDPALASTAAAFDLDVQTVVRLATAAVLVHDRTGTFPSDAFGLLGSEEGAQTGARALGLSALTIETPPAEATSAVGAFSYIPLPDPYVRDDEVVRVVVLQKADGSYEAQYRIRRERDPDLGGGALLYDRVAGYRVGTGFGTLCIEPARARAHAASGAFVPDPLLLSDAPLTIRVHPPGADAPVYYEAVRTGASR